MNIPHAVFVAFSCFIITTASAVPIVEDPFLTDGTHYTEAALVGQGPAATGFAGNWLEAFGRAESPLVSANNLGFTDGTNPMLTSGGSINYSGAGNGRAGRALTQPFGAASTGTIYLGVLLQLETTGTDYRAFEIHQGGFDDGANRTLQIAAGEPGVGTTDSNYIVRLFNDAAFATDLGAGDTDVNLFVIRINFSTDANADTITIWRNPENLLDEASSAADATFCGFDFRFDRTSLGRFGDDGITMDEIRSGGIWSDATTVIDPTDTDDDDMLDTYELANGLTVGINDAADDLDMDGFSNLEEHDRNTRANVFDTDSDGLLDGVENNSGTFTDTTMTGTNPHTADSDLDDESDGVEVREGTDPTDDAESSASLGRVIIDGTRDDLYGDALAVQTVQTGFGDNQSEWNAAYAHITGGKLHLMFTGNLQDNFNKLEIFIDSTTGGSTTFTSAGNDGAGNMNGMVFDTEFAPDYHLTARRGSGKFDIDIADLNAPAFDSYIEVFPTGTEGIGTTATGTVNSSPIRLGYDNSNLAGIGGDGGQLADEAAALAVTTGLELCIALDDLNITGGETSITTPADPGSREYYRVATGEVPQ